MALARDVFISYAHADEGVAAELEQRLEAGGLTTFRAAADVAPAQQWQPAIRNALRGARVVLVLVSPKSKDNKWVMAEAGAAWALDIPIVPVLSYVSPGDNIEILSSAQGRPFETSEQRTQLVDELVREFGGQARHTYDVFLASPMAAYDSDAAYVAARTEVMKVIDALREHCKYEVFSALLDCPSMTDFDSRDISIVDDLDALEHSRNFVLIYPERILSSVLTEVGYALALRIPSVYWVRDRTHLPFMLQQADSVFERVRLHTMSSDSNYDDIVTRIARHGTKLFTRSNL